MESLVMVAYIVSITAGFPLAEVTTTADGEQREQVERAVNLNSSGKGKSYSTDATANVTAVGSEVTTDNDDYILRTGDSNLITSYVMTSDQERESRLRGDDVTSASLVRTESVAASIDWRVTGDRLQDTGGGEGGGGGGLDPTTAPESSLLDSSLLTFAQTELRSPRDFTDALQTTAELEQQQLSTTTTTTTATTTTATATTATATTTRTTNETDEREVSGEVTFWTVVEMDDLSSEEEDSGSGEEDQDSEAERRRRRSSSSSAKSLASTESQVKEEEEKEEEDYTSTESRDVPMSSVTIVGGDKALLDEATFQHYSAIVEALEKLKVLDSDGKWCYSVESIDGSSQTSQSSSSALLWKVELRIEAVPMSSSSSSLPSDEFSTQLQRLEGAGSYVQPTSGVECIVDSTSGVISAGSIDCIPVPDNATDDETPVHNGSGSIPENKKLSGAQHNDNGALKPSKTQIFVISTCSTVIGLFFVVALIMRIRNHLKRTRTLNKHRGGVRHHRPTSGPRDPPSASTLPLATSPPTDANHKQNDVSEKSNSSVGRSRRFFDRRWNSAEQKEGEAKTPMTMTTTIRRQGELKRFFVSQRSQREAAREYIRQLSLTCPAHTHPPPVGEQPPSAVETSPKSPSKKLVSPPPRSSQKLNIS